MANRPRLWVNSVLNLRIRISGMAAERTTEANGSGLAIGQQGALAVVNLQRPAARNALTVAMRAQIAAEIPKWARDPQIYALAIGSTVPGTFSAGGDVREILALAAGDPEGARAALAAEYTLNWLLECFSKPTVSLIDGPVMGTGAGITIYGTHRVAGERYAFAMPEVRIGFFPDDGLAFVLSRIPDFIGMYLGLTGRRIGRADAYRLGLATHCVAESDFGSICAALADAQPIDPLLESVHRDPGPAEIDTWREVIARCFSAESVAEIRARLGAETGTAGRWAAGVLADLDRASPLALVLTHRHILEARARDLRQVLTIDFRLAVGLLNGHDFREGVRATFIEKDGVARWRPAALAEVTPGLVERLFHPRQSGEELILPTRQEMQAARI